MNASEARIIFEAAGKANVWIGDGLWTRALPIAKELVNVLHKKKAIGHVLKIVSDFGFHVDVAAKSWESRYRDPKLGAGSLLDMDVYR